MRAVAQCVVAAHTGGAVVVHAHGKRVVRLHGPSVSGQLYHAAAGGLGKLKAIFHAGIVVEIVVRHLGLHEFLGDRHTPVFAHLKVGRAVFHGLLQLRAGHAQKHQRVGVHIGGNHVAHGHVFGEAAHLVGKAGAAHVAAGDPRLHAVEQVGNRRAVQRHEERFFGRERPVQAGNGRIQPRLHLVLQRGQRGGRRALSLGGNQTRRNLSVLPQNLGIARRVRGRLHDVGARPFRRRNCQMLMPREQDVERADLGDFAREVLAAVRIPLPRFQILLHAAVIHAHRHVACPAKRFIRPLHRRKRVVHAQLRKVRGLFPAVHPVRYRAHDSHAQSVRQRAHVGLKKRHLPAQVLHVRRQHPRVQRVQIAGKHIIAIVEIVVAHGHIIVARVVHCLREQTSAAVMRGVIGEGRALQRVAAVDRERVFVARGAEHPCQRVHAHRPIAGVNVVRGKEIAVQVGGKQNLQPHLFASPSRMPLRFSMRLPVSL